MKKINLVTFSLLLFTAFSGGFGDEASNSQEEEFTDAETQKEIAALELKHTGVYWAKPDFSHQENALGWAPDVFDAPPGFKKRVGFWIDIYTKYTTHQALLHDAQYLDIVYKILDFTDIDADPSLSPTERERAKKKRVKEEKKTIVAQLERIQKLEDTPSKMSPDDLALFKKFKLVNEKNKFITAGRRGRLRMQLGQKDRFILGIYFSGRYIREMERIFKEEGVPMELTRLPFVESSFNLYAYSRVGASGIWQFMRSTGRLFMKIDPIKDSRNDPLMATRAAAKLLRGNFKMLESWPLALTAYNHGPQGVASIRKKMKTDDINEIVWNTTRRKFGFASENFYAEFLAALAVESHASKYFGKLEVSAPLEYEEVPLPQPLHFSDMALVFSQLTPDQSLDDGLDKARLYNPFFTRPVLASLRTIPKDAMVRVPKNQKEKFLDEMKKLQPLKVSVTLKSGLYKVLPGDTLSSIGQEFGISVRQLLEVNNMSPKSLLHPGQKLVVPTLEDGKGSLH